MNRTNKNLNYQVFRGQGRGPGLAGPSCPKYKGGIGA